MAADELQYLSEMDAPGGDGYWRKVRAKEAPVGSFFLATRIFNAVGSVTTVNMRAIRILNCGLVIWCLRRGRARWGSATIRELRPLVWISHVCP